MNEREDGSDDGFRVSSGFNEPAVDWQYLDEEILRRVTRNDAGVAALRVNGSSNIFDDNIVDGESFGVATGANQHLQKLYISAFPRGANALEALFRGLAHNRSIQHLFLCQLDLSQVDIFAVMLPFFEHNINLRCIEVLWSMFSAQRTSSFLLAMSKCKQLERIVLRYNDYGFQVTRVIKSLRSHRNLLELKLGGELEHEACVDLAKMLGRSASKLLSLELHDDLDDQSLAILAECLGRSNVIKKFNFFGNGGDRITTTGWASLSLALRNPSCSLEIISLEGTRMNNDGAINLGSSLAVNNTVNHLSLSCSSYITSVGWAAIANSLRNPNSALVQINISKCFYVDDDSDEDDDGDESDYHNTALDDDAVMKIAESLAVNSSLKKLDMSYNFQITSEGWGAFFTVLLYSECSLEELDLSHNHIDDEGGTLLVDLLVSMSNFHTLYLRRSALSANGLRLFTRLLEPNSKMKKLDLGGNDFDDEVVIDFADALANNTALNTLTIGGTVSDRSWNALSCVLCDNSSIKNTYTSNHTLHTIEKTDGMRIKIRDDLSSSLCMNKVKVKADVVRQKILAHHFQRPIQTVVVKGCGVPEINGYFTPDGSHDGASKYTKRTLYRGQETEFLLFRCQLTDDTRRWYISIVPMNAHPGTTNDIDFYISPRGGDGSLPPRHDWLRISENEGLNPAPEVHLIGGSTNVQVFVDMKTTMLPSAIEWIGRDKFGFSLMCDVIRAIPTLGGFLPP
jgi:hypothetical protein